MFVSVCQSSGFVSLKLKNPNKVEKIHKDSATKMWNSESSQSSILFNHFLLVLFKKNNIFHRANVFLVFVEFLKQQMLCCTSYSFNLYVFSCVYLSSLSINVLPSMSVYTAGTETFARPNRWCGEPHPMFGGINKGSQREKGNPHEQEKAPQLQWWVQQQKIQYSSDLPTWDRGQGPRLFYRG